MANNEGEEHLDGDALAEYVQTLFPMQQQAIATAQLAGCRFERRTYERYVGRYFRKTGWVSTTEYEVFLPDGTSAGTGEDIYECALIALSTLNTDDTKPTPVPLFKLNPENEPQ